MAKKNSRTPIWIHAEGRKLRKFNSFATFNRYVEKLSPKLNATVWCLQADSPPMAPHAATLPALPPHRSQ